MHEVEVGFDSEGHVPAFRDTFLVDCGAWNPIGVAIAYNTAVHLLGPYRIANFAATARIVATNKVPNAAPIVAPAGRGGLRHGADHGPDRARRSASNPPRSGAAT